MSLGPTVILLALHTLLSHAHHLNLKKRQEIPGTSQRPVLSIKERN